MKNIFFDVNSVSGLYLHLSKVLHRNSMLPFDMCRWQVEGTKVEAVDGAIAECL